MTDFSFRAFAVIPAAGASRRMGEPKLLLPWRGRTLIEQTLAAWRQCPLEALVAVVRPEDAALAAACRRVPGVEVVMPPIDPPHMRDSVQYALDWIETHCRPAAGDVWLLAPADMPELSPAIVRKLLASHRPEDGAILVPTLAGRRGHPVLFPWPAAAQVRQLPPDRGINALHWQFPSREVACDDLAAGEEPFADIDTPEDYQRRAR